MNRPPTGRNSPVTDMMSCCQSFQQKQTSTPLQPKNTNKT